MRCVAATYQEQFCTVKVPAVFSALSCLKNTTVAKGTYIEIVNKDGLPVKVTHPCDDDSYEPDDRGSSSVTHPYCIKQKTKCSKPGQQLLCRGGPTRDNQCQCMPGWRSDCSRGFTGDDLCSCNRLPCPSGTERNITYQKDRELCPAETIPLKYTCITVKTAEVSTPAKLYRHFLPFRPKPHTKNHC